MREVGHSPVRVAHKTLPDLCSDPPQPCRWYALYTASRHEKRVAQHLRQREIEFFGSSAEFVGKARGRS
ncbi:MAG: transcription termination/antitermination NusG family protein [Terracidiphilus sp.]